MHNILNFYQITKNIATSGQPKADQFIKIKEAGCSVIINLAMSDASNAVPEEESIIRSLEMTYIHIPVPFDRPTVQHLRAFFGVMDTFSGESVFVHCALNMRVSAFMYQYLTLRHALPKEQSRSPILQEWLPKMDEQWNAIITLTAGDLGL